MNATNIAQLFANRTAPGASGKMNFRRKFQNSLRTCIERGFSLEEAFGMIWVETWEEIALTEQDQSELYEELIKWAKMTFLEPKAAVIHRSYSPSRLRF